MRVSSERFKIFNPPISSCFGFAPETVGGDSSLSALICTIAYKNADWKKGDGAVYSTSASNFEDIKYILDDEFCHKLSIIKKTGDWNFEASDGWVLLNDKKAPISSYLSARERLKTEVYINSELRRVIATVTGYADDFWVQSFESVFPKIFSWYYPEITDEVRAMSYALSVEDKENLTKAVEPFVSHLNKMADELFDKASIIEAALGDYETAGKSRRIESAQCDVEAIERKIQELINTINAKYREYDEKSELLKCLKLGLEEKTFGIVDFFKTHTNVEFLNADTYSDFIEYRVNDTLEYFDVDEFEDLYKNKYSYLYTEIDYGSDVAEIFKAIFSDKLGKFRITARYRLNNMRGVSLCSGGTYPDGYAPNPHVYYHACTGSNGAYYNEYRERGDWEMGMEQSIAQTKNIWFGDSTVVPEFTRWVEDNMDTKCIEYDNNILTPSEFLEKIREA